jgi:hypothetical protein
MADRAQAVRGPAVLLGGSFRLRDSAAAEGG